MAVVAAALEPVSLMAVGTRVLGCSIAAAASSRSGGIPLQLAVLLLAASASVSSDGVASNVAASSRAEVVVERETTGDATGGAELGGANEAAALCASDVLLAAGADAEALTVPAVSESAAVGAGRVGGCDGDDDDSAGPAELGGSDAAHGSSPARCRATWLDSSSTSRRSIELCERSANERSASSVSSFCSSAERAVTWSCCLRMSRAEADSSSSARRSACCSSCCRRTTSCSASMAAALCRCSRCCCCTAAYSRTISAAAATAIVAATTVTMVHSGQAEPATDDDATAAEEPEPGSATLIATVSATAAHTSGTNVPAPTGPMNPTVAAERAGSREEAAPRAVAVAVELDSARSSTATRSSHWRSPRPGIVAAAAAAGADTEAEVGALLRCDGCAAGRPVAAAIVLLLLAPRLRVGDLLLLLDGGDAAVVWLATRADGAAVEATER